MAVGGGAEAVRVQVQRADPGRQGPGHVVAQAVPDVDDRARVGGGRPSASRASAKIRGSGLDTPTTAESMTTPTSTPLASGSTSSPGPRSRRPGGGGPARPRRSSWRRCRPAGPGRRCRAARRATPGPTWVQANPSVRPTMSLATESTSAAGTPHAAAKSRRYSSHHWPRPCGPARLVAVGHGPVVRPLQVGQAGFQPGGVQWGQQQFRRREQHDAARVEQDRVDRVRPRARYDHCPWSASLGVRGRARRSPRRRRCRASAGPWGAGPRPRRWAGGRRAAERVDAVGARGRRWRSGPG